MRALGRQGRACALTKTALAPPRAGTLRISRSGPEPGYRPCVGLMVINPAGLVWIGERRGVAGSWQMPQGGIDRGERPLDAALRELAEEIGTARVELAAESRHWYAYDLPPESVAAFHHGRYRGQSQKWFALRFVGRDAEIDVQTAKPEFLRWRWALPAEVVDLIVPFKRAVYEAVFAEFRPQLER